MRSFWFLLLCFLLPLQLLSDDGSKIVRTAEKYLYVRECGSNRGKEIEMFQHAVNVPPGSPWCAAFVRYVLDEAKNTYIKIRSGLAQSYITKQSIKAKDVAKGYKTIKPGWLAIWKDGNTYRGHIAIVKKWFKNEGTTIEGNTGDSGGREGDGVYRKHRKIIDYAYFRITYFTPTY